MVNAPSSSSPMQDTPFPPEGLASPGHLAASPGHLAASPGLPAASPDNDIAETKLKDLPRDGVRGRWRFSVSERGYVTRSVMLEVLADLDEWLFLLCSSQITCIKTRDILN